MVWKVVACPDLTAVLAPSTPNTPSGDSPRLELDASGAWKKLFRPRTARLSQPAEAPEKQRIYWNEDSLHVPVLFRLCTSLKGRKDKSLQLQLNLTHSSASTWMTLYLQDPRRSCSNTYSFALCSLPFLSCAVLYRSFNILTLLFLKFYVWLSILLTFT